MPEIGCFLSSEEQGPHQLLEIARLAEEAGFRSVLISDHYHPWTDRQGESPFVWSVIGAIAGHHRVAGDHRRDLPDGANPSRRCSPRPRPPPQLLLEGRFRFGVGSGEALNEHILGDRWPPADVRLEMLEEAVGVIRELWTGRTVSHRGRHYTVERARIYSLPDEPPPILVSGFGPKATGLAARIGDGFVNTAPDRRRRSRLPGARRHGTGRRGDQGLLGPDEAAARKLAFDLWPTTGVAGELSQELPTPEHFEQACAERRPRTMIATRSCAAPTPNAMPR